MAYNPAMYFPQNYQYPAFQQQQMPPQQPQQMMTLPTIHAEIVQVDNEEAATSYPVGAGASQMMMAKDDSAIFIKTASANGEVSFTAFDRRPPKPKPAPFDPKEYVRKDEIEEIISSMKKREENDGNL